MCATSKEIQFYVIIHQIFSHAGDWSKSVTWANISQLKLGNIPRIFPNFQNCARCEKDLKDNKHNSLHLGRKYARIFVLGHYLFLVAHSFCYSEHTMSADKYPSILSRQIEAIIVYLCVTNLCLRYGKWSTRAFLPP